MFQYHDDSSKGYQGFNIFPNSYRKTNLLSILEGKKRDPFGSNRYGRKGYDRTFLEFVWIVLWSFLSKDTYDRVEEFLSVASPDTHAYPQGSVGEKVQTTRFLTCFLQVTSSSVYVSRFLWRKGYIRKNGRERKRKVDQMGELGLAVNLLISSITHSTKCSAKTGVHPKPPWFFNQNIPALEACNDELPFENLLRNDLVVLFTAVYYWNLNEDHNYSNYVASTDSIKVRLEDSINRGLPAGEGIVLVGNIAVDPLIGEKQLVAMDPMI